MAPNQSARLGLALLLIGVGVASDHRIHAEETKPHPNASERPREAPVEAGPLHPIEVRNPPTLGTVDTGLRDASGAYVGVACATCHAPDRPDALARLGDLPADFHGGIELAHGDLSCESCHAPDDRTRLRLADGRKLEMSEVLTLCGQCHGPQLRNFWKGSHGGGRGYWDRTKGPWIRNNCVSCHAAHAPAYPLVMPAPPPNDRFVPRPHATTSKETEHE